MNSLHVNGHHHHEIVALTTTDHQHHNMTGSMSGIMQRSWRFFQILAWIAVCVILGLYIFSEKQNLSENSKSPPRLTSTENANYPTIVMGSNIQEHKKEIQSGSLQSPDLMFALTPEQNEERLHFMLYKPYRPKQMKSEKSASIDESNDEDADDSDSNEKQMNRSDRQELHGDEDGNNYRDEDEMDSRQNDSHEGSEDDSKDASEDSSEDSRYKIDLNRDNKYRASSSHSQDSPAHETHDTHETHETVNLPLCTRNQLKDGKWEREVLDKPPYVTPTLHLRCYPHDTYYGSSYKTWKWLPIAKKEKKCSMASFFDRSEFCRVLPGAVVSIVGDSLSWEHYSSIIQLNGLKTHQGYQHQSRELGVNIFQSVCKGRTKVLYRRDDKLQNLTSSLLQNFPVVLVLNRGAHWVPDDELIPDIKKNIDELMEHWVPKCLHYKIKCHLFWRTSVPGHPGCSVNVKSSEAISNTGLGSAYKEPINDLQKMEALIGNLTNYDNHTINYHWYDYQHQNQLVIHEFQEAFQELSTSSPYFRFEIIDAYYLNVLRPDEHRAHQGDCLHNCYPGKMDVYSNLMLHYLQMQRSENDIEHLQDIVQEHKLWTLSDTTKYEPEATEIARQIREGKRRVK